MKHTAKWQNANIWRNEYITAMQLYTPKDYPQWKEITCGFGRVSRGKTNIMDIVYEAVHLALCLPLDAYTKSADVPSYFKQTQHQ